MDFANFDIYFNRAEAVLWFAFAALCLIASLRRGTAHRRTLAILAVAFAVFGVSDLIETRTGAWYRPWWLFAMKAACVLTITPCGWKLWKARPRQ